MLLHLASNLKSIIPSMKKITILAALLALGHAYAQGPAVTSWLQNTTQTGTYYVSGNSTAIGNNILVNCQLVEYSNDFVYVHTEGVPAYATGPFLDGNPSNATAQGAIYKMPLNPVANTGAPTPTTPGTIGAFINGVSLYDYRDGVAWDPSTEELCGGPPGGNPMCPGGMGAAMDWNRDAIPAEMGGFDCSKAHPAMGNYHHHQNPSAFNLDLSVVSNICNLYDAEGLYAIDAAQHSPLLGFAYDGFPIYGAYGYANEDGTGGIARMKSSYELADASNRTGGPSIATWELGYFREDYVFVAHPGEDDYLDEHNGRECNTPEYPDGTYAYFCTVDENWNSSYPYVVGPTFYGTYANRSVNSVTESTTTYESTVGIDAVDASEINVTVFPNPSADLIVVQIKGLVTENLPVSVFDLSGKQVAVGTISAGSTIWYLDTRSIYDGTYIIRIGAHTTKRVIVSRQ